jgi:hypothetical protein
LAFDYDPFTAAEMDRLAEPILWHLMDRKVKLMIVSLLPTGPAIAENLLDRVTQEHYGGYQYGQDYVNLGYIPGQAAAPNELASDLRALVPQDYRQGKSLGDFPATQNVNDIQDVKLIIEADYRICSPAEDSTMVDRAGGQPASGRDNGRSQCGR